MASDASLLYVFLLFCGEATTRLSAYLLIYLLIITLVRSFPCAISIGKDTPFIPFLQFF